MRYREGKTARHGGRRGEECVMCMVGARYTREKGILERRRDTWDEKAKKIKNKKKQAKEKKNSR